MTELRTWMLILLVCLPKNQSTIWLSLGRGRCLANFHIKNVPEAFFFARVSDLKFSLHKVAYVSFASLEHLECYKKCCHSVRLLTIYSSLIWLYISDRICYSKGDKLENTIILSFTWNSAAFPGGVKVIGFCAMTKR